MRWRNFQGMICVCSHHAPHVGLPEVDRVGFWQELVVVARLVRSTMDIPLLIAGDANVWHPEFSLGRSADWMALFHVLSQVVKLWWTSCTRSSWPFCLGTLSDVLPHESVCMAHSRGPHSIPGCADHIPSDSALGPAVLLVALARPRRQALPHAPPS